MEVNEKNLNLFLNIIDEEWEKDSDLDVSNIIEAEIETSRLHSKYLNFRIKAKRMLAQLEYDFNILRGKKSKYYRGKMTKNELDIEKWQPFQYNLKTKGEVDEVMTYDEDINRIVKLISLCNTIIESCDSCLYNIRQRTWQIKNIIDIKKFEAGV